MALEQAQNMKRFFPVIDADGHVLERDRELREFLPAENQHDRPLAPDGDSPGRGAFVGIGGAQNDQAGDRAKARKMFDGLMRRAVFAQTDAVVGEDKGNVRSHH